MISTFKVVRVGGITVNGVHFSENNILHVTKWSNARELVQDGKGNSVITFNNSILDLCSVYGWLVVCGTERGLDVKTPVSGKHGRYYKNTGSELKAIVDICENPIELLRDFEPVWFVVRTKFKGIPLNYRVSFNSLLRRDYMHEPYLISKVLCERSWTFSQRARQYSHYLCTCNRLGIRPNIRGGELLLNC